MMISVWYHGKLSGEGIPNEGDALLLYGQQMNALKESGLLAEADDLFIGINGGDGDALLAAALCPCTRPHLLPHGIQARSELPTLAALQSWLLGHPDWYVFYHHMKGVTHPHDKKYQDWRGRMEQACVWNWRQCVQDLNLGYDAVGCHWLTPQKFPGSVTSPFFGGTYWWARAKYLLQLPKLPAPTWENRYEAESWIGRRRPYPMVRDYHPGWP